MRENAHRSRGVFHPSTLLASCSGSCCRRFFLGALAWTCPRAQTSYRRRANYTAASGILAGQAPCTLVYGGCGHLLYLAVGCLCGVALHVRAVHAPSGGLEEENHELRVGEAGGHVRTGRFRTSPSSAAISLSKSASSASRSAIATAGRGGKSLMIMFCFSWGRGMLNGIMRRSTGSTRDRWWDANVSGGLGNVGFPEALAAKRHRELLRVAQESVDVAEIKRCGVVVDMGRDASGQGVVVIKSAPLLDRGEQGWQFALAHLVQLPQSLRCCAYCVLDLVCCLLRAAPRWSACSRTSRAGT